MELASTIMQITASAIEIAGGVGGIVVKVSPLDRECLVELCNESSQYSLCNPSFHTRSGVCSVPLPPMIKPMTSGEALFTKAPVVARGAVGVFTYDLLNNCTQSYTGKIGVMYKVPFDLNIQRIEYAIGFFDIDTPCNKELFRKMSQSTDPSFVKGKAKSSSLTHKGEAVTLRATMSTSYSAVMKIQVSNY